MRIRTTPKKIGSMLHQVTSRTSLHPQDGGKAAWLFLFAAAVILMTTWGFAISFGIFRQYYFVHVPFQGVQIVAEIGVMATGLLQAMSPFLLRYLGNRPSHRKPAMWLGMVICSCASLVAAFSKTVIQLVMTQGVLFGIGSGLLFAPFVSLIDEWFVHRRSLAYGLYFGACSLAGAILPPIFSVLLTEYGGRTTMIGWALVSFVLISAAILCMRSCIHTAPLREAATVSVSYGYIRQPLFWLVALSTVLQALAQYLPAVYLPSYAVDLGATTEQGSLLLTYFNFVSVICQPSLGYLADVTGVLLPLLLSTILSCVAVLLIWGFARPYWSIDLVAVHFGGFSGGFVVLRNRFATAIVGDLKHPNQELIISGTLMLLRGVATLVSGFMGQAVVQAGQDLGIQPGYGAGMWKGLLLMDGIIMGAASVGALGFLKKGAGGRKAYVESVWEIS